MLDHVSYIWDKNNWFILGNLDDYKDILTFLNKSSSFSCQRDGICHTKILLHKLYFWIIFVVSYICKVCLGGQTKNFLLWCIFSGLSDMIAISHVYFI
jgi:hypothetical protein